MYPTSVKNVEQVCATLASITICMVLYLIIFKSSKQVGAYKYLMIYMSIFELFYAILNVLSPTQVFTKDSGFLVVLNQDESFFPVRIFNVLFFTMFGTSMANFGVHFVFRYFVVIGKTEYTSSTLSNLVMWFICPLTLGSVHTASVVHFMDKSDILEQFLR
ncbi:unnamed protein product [Caenorhabditis brenneri]